jgi:hypothetical protein
MSAKNILLLLMGLFSNNVKKIIIYYLLFSGYL